MNCPHCNVEVASHAASRCMDAWVDSAVFGWKTVDGQRVRLASLNIDGPIPAYSTDIAAAWGMVEKLRSGAYVDIGVDAYGAQVQLNRRGDAGWEVGESVRADTAPLAICRATLKAV